MTQSRISLNKLVESLGRQYVTPISQPAGITHAWEQGFHVYGQLSLTLPLAASEDTQSAVRYLRIIQAYAAIADKCAQVAGGVLLEVQGEVIHALLPGELSKDAVDSVIAFSIALGQIVYAEIEPLAGDAWKSYVMATDHGHAVLIGNGNGSSDSIVSLGPAANSPAKQLPITEAGHLSIKTEVLALVCPNVDCRKTWEQFDFRNPLYMPRSGGMSQSQKYLLNESIMRAEAKRIMENRASMQPQIRVLTEQDITGEIENDVNSPFKTQGFYMRADLDGFTADVAKAFEESSETAVIEIVKRFSAFMAFADAFAKSLNRRVLRLPWAGDCCNMILLPRSGITYSRERSYVPAVEAARWHDLTAQADADGRKWRDVLMESEWAVSIAGGDKEEEGSDGYLLVANIETSGRKFKIASGWGAGRSHDALETEGVHGRDTVIHKVDYEALSGNYRQHFKPLNSLFYKAGDLSMGKIKNEAVKAERQTGPAIIVGSDIVLPPPKPHYVRV